VFLLQLVKLRHPRCLAHRSWSARQP
jgi:hypothetical protein